MKIYKYIIGIVSCALVLSCQKSDEVDTNNSIFDTPKQEQNAFDKWLHTNYIETYNIDYQYKIKDIDINYQYNLVPASLKNSMMLAKVIKHAWLEAYTEVAGINFIRKHAPAILPIIGSAAWNDGGTMTLGTAEGGLKITLYLGNWLDPKNIAQMNEYFFKTMHHEFTHILQQDKYYPNAEYDKISQADYRPSGWNNRKLDQYAPLGFITAYAGSSAVEDITEVTACYITMTKQEWDRVFEAAGDEGRAKLEQKVKIMKSYMKGTWGIDMDVLKSVVHRRMAEVAHMTLLNSDWLPLIDNSNQPINPLEPKEATIERLRSQKSRAMKDVMATPHHCHIHDANMLNIINK